VKLETLVLEHPDKLVGFPNGESSWCFLMVTLNSDLIRVSSPAMICFCNMIDPF
jgi:hypothetical protein